MVFFLAMLTFILGIVTVRILSAILDEIFHIDDE